MNGNRTRDLRMSYQAIASLIRVHIAVSVELSEVRNRRIMRIISGTVVTLVRPTICYCVLCVDRWLNKANIGNKRWRLEMRRLAWCCCWSCVVVRSDCCNCLILFVYVIWTMDTWVLLHGFYYMYDCMTNFILGKSKLCERVW